MKIFFVRHGQTFHNLKKISQGYYNSQLTDLGKKQAKLVASRFKDEKIDFCYSSDLDRTIDTAQEILKFHGNINLIKDKRLREQSKGIYENQPRTVINKVMANLDIPWWDFKPEQGEHMLEVTKRISEFFNEINKKHPLSNILIVGHGGSLASLFNHIENDRLDTIKNYLPMENTGVSLFENKKFIFINSSEHLSNNTDPK